MEGWELECEKKRDQILGPAGGHPTVGFRVIFGEKIKKAKEMEASFNHVLPKIDLNHDFQVDTEELSKATNTKNMDAETKKVVDFLGNTIYDFEDLRMPGDARHDLAVSKADMSRMTDLVSNNGGLGYESYLYAMDYIRQQLKQVEFRKGNSLNGIVWAAMEQQSIKTSAPNVVSSVMPIIHGQLERKVHHFREALGGQYQYIRPAYDFSGKKLRTDASSVSGK